MYRIKCSNGLYVQKTTMGDQVSFSKNGKVWHSKNIAEKNLKWCRDYVPSHSIKIDYDKHPHALKALNERKKEYKDLTYTLEEG